jgi:hypothetical protein
MTLKIGWLHEAENNLGTWLHEADDWHVAVPISGLVLAELNNARHQTSRIDTRRNRRCV